MDKNATKRDVFFTMGLIMSTVYMSLEHVIMAMVWLTASIIFLLIDIK